jgi:hypothetical protein
MSRPQYRLRVDEIRVFYDVVEAAVQTQIFHSLYKMMFCAMLYACPPKISIGGGRYLSSLAKQSA